MDVIIISYIVLPFACFMCCSFLWIWARREEVETVRVRKMYGVFLVWFLPNWLFILNSVLTPTWYEPSPVVPSSYALGLTLPIFTLFSLFFALDFLTHTRRARKTGEAATDKSAA